MNYNEKYFIIAKAFMNGLFCSYISRWNMPFWLQKAYLRVSKQPQPKTLSYVSFVPSFFYILVLTPTLRTLLFLDLHFSDTIRRWRNFLKLTFEKIRKYDFNPMISLWNHLLIKILDSFHLKVLISNHDNNLLK